MSNNRTTLEEIKKKTFREKFAERNKNNWSYEGFETIRNEDNKDTGKVKLTYKNGIGETRVDIKDAKTDHVYSRTIYNAQNEQVSQYVYSVEKTTDEIGNTVTQHHEYKTEYNKDKSRIEKHYISIDGTTVCDKITEYNAKGKVVSEDCLDLRQIEDKKLFSKVVAAKDTLNDLERKEWILAEKNQIDFAHLIRSAEPNPSIEENQEEKQSTDTSIIAYQGTGYRLSEDGYIVKTEIIMLGKKRIQEIYDGKFGDQEYSITDTYREDGSMINRTCLNEEKGIKISLSYDNDGQAIAAQTTIHGTLVQNTEYVNSEPKHKKITNYEKGIPVSAIYIAEDGTEIKREEYDGMKLKEDQVKEQSQENPELNDKNTTTKDTKEKTAEQVSEVAVIPEYIENMYQEAYGSIDDLNALDASREEESHVPNQEQPLNTGGFDKQAYEKDIANTVDFGASVIQDKGNDTFKSPSIENTSIEAIKKELDEIEM